MYLLGIDLGTTAIKIGLFDERGRTIAVANNEYELYTPSSAIVELDAQIYWDTFKLGLAEVLNRSQIDARELGALSISAQSETLVPVDEDGVALRNAIVWMDTRAQKQAENLGKVFSRKLINQITGQTDMMAIWPCSKILWMKENEPELFTKTKKFLLLEDYFIFRLTGLYIGEGSLWSSSLMWDITRKQYWPEMLAELSIDETLLPKVIESGVDVGSLLPDVSKELGLCCETRVVTGGLDGALGAMGVGNVVTGIFTESGGSSLTACLLTEKPFFDEKLEMPCFYSPVKGTYLITAFSSGGICYRWARDKLCSAEMDEERKGGPDAYYQMDKKAAEIPAGCDGLTVLPHFLGAGMPDTDSYAKCTITGLTLAHTRDHIVRGFMEGVACVLRRMVDSLEKSGMSIGEIRSMGGAAKSKLWCRIKSDVTQKRLITLKNTQDSACLGAVILAGIGIGLWKSAEDAYSHFEESISDVYSPNKSLQAVYDALFERYILLMKTFKTINSKI